MQIQRNESNFPLAGSLFRAWDRLKDLRVRTPATERRWFIPAPSIVWHAESLADLGRELAKVEAGDSVILRHARFERLVSEGVVALNDGSAEREFRLDANPFDIEQMVPASLMRLFSSANQRSSVYDIIMAARPVFDEQLTWKADGVELRITGARANCIVPASFFELD